MARKPPDRKGDPEVSFNWPGASSLALTLVLLTVSLMFGALFATRRAGRRETGP